LYISASQEGSTTGIEEIVNAVPDIIYQLDDEGKIVFISKAIESYGFTPDELIGHFIFDLIHPDDQEKAKYRINERRTGERSTKSLELRLLTKSREAVPFEFRAVEGEEVSATTLLIDAEGIYSSDMPDRHIFLYTQGVARDISERKVLEDEQQRLHDELERRVAERTADLQAANFQLHREIAERKNAVAAAQQSEARYRRLVELSPDAVFLFSDGRIVFANALGAQLLGANKPDDLDGRLLRDFRAEMEPFGASDAIVESRFVRVDGREIDVELRTTPFVYQDQPAVLAVVRDITLAKRKSLQQVAHQNLHEMVWRMQNPADSDKILTAIRKCLNASGIAYRFCGIYLVGEVENQPQVQHFEYILVDSETVRVAALKPEEAALALQFWHADIPFYRPDLEKEDRYQEKEAISALLGEQLRAVLDLPFSHGMLRLGASQPEAFSPMDIAALQEISTLVQAGFRRIEDLRRLAVSSREAVALAEGRQQDLAREETMGRIRDKIIAMRTIPDLPSEEYWVGELCQLGLSIEGISLQFPASREGYFVTFFFKENHYSEEMPLEHFPWVGEVWASGEPVLVPRQRLAVLGHDHWEAQFLLEVPMPGGGSLGVRSLAAEVFDEQEVRSVRLFAGLLAEGLQRIQDFAVLSQHEEQLREAQKMEAIGQLTAGIAHNFNNMLQGIMGNLHLALREAPPPVEELLEDAERGTRRAADMVQQLMVFARQGVVPEYSAVNASLLLHDTVDICRQTFNKRINIEVSIPEDLPPVLGDIGHLSSRAKRFVK
jgi:PAS domain S-box-containing protein